MRIVRETQFDRILLYQIIIRIFSGFQAIRPEILMSTEEQPEVEQRSFLDLSSANRTLETDNLTSPWSTG